jgi:hypothetical protein
MFAPQSCRGSGYRLFPRCSAACHRPVLARPVVAVLAKAKLSTQAIEYENRTEAQPGQRRPDPSSFLPLNWRTGRVPTSGAKAASSNKLHLLGAFGVTVAAQASTRTPEKQFS